MHGIHHSLWRPPATYVGKTKRNLSKLVNECKMAVRRADVDESALTESVWNTGYEVDWKVVTILDCNHDL